MEFVVGKKYHAKSSSNYMKILFIHKVDGRKYITTESRDRGTNGLYQVATYSENALANYVPYTTTVTHERWVIWFKLRDGKLSCTIDEETKESWEERYPFWKVLSYEKITYTEVVDE